MGLSLKSLLPIAGAAAGYFFGGPAGSAALNAALGSGIGTLAAGGDATDAVKNAILAGGSGALLNTAGVPGATAGAEAAKQKVYQDAVMREAAKQTASQAATQAATAQAAKQGIFGTGITGGDIFLGSSLLGLLEEPEDISDDFDPSSLESRPDYEGTPISGLFVDPKTGKAYNTLEELEAAVQEQQTNNFANGGIAALADSVGGFIEGPGTGTSDSINAGIYQNGQKVQEAKLSDEEFVMTKKAVAGAGNGDTKLGAKRMYALMDKFERMA